MHLLACHWMTEGEAFGMQAEAVAYVAIEAVAYDGMPQSVGRSRMNA